jgi:hypothetical protein
LYLEVPEFYEIPLVSNEDFMEECMKYAYKSIINTFRYDVDRVFDKKIKKNT